MSAGNNTVLKYLKFINEEVKILYNGPIEGKLLSSIGAYIRAIHTDNPRVGRKLMSIYVELIHNVSLYSADRRKTEKGDSVGAGIFSVSEYDSHYSLATGNLIPNEKTFQLIDKCEYINSLGRDKLREYKRNQRHLPFGIDGNAHIGLIQISLISLNKIEYEITPAKDNLSFFSIVVKVDKTDLEEKEGK